MNDTAADPAAAAAFEADTREIAMAFLVITRPAETVDGWIAAGTFADHIDELAALFTAKLGAEDFAKLCDALSAAIELTAATPTI